MTLFEAQPGDIAHLIQLAVAPVFLLSGVGITLSLFSTRLARIVDRARDIQARTPHDAEHEAELREKMEVLSRRSHFINLAITLGTISGLLVAITVVLLFANALLVVNLSGAIVVAFATAMLTLTAALFVFLIEVRIATEALRKEIQL